MQCPKCQYQQVDSNLECQRCGIIFKKYYHTQEVQDIDHNDSTPEVPSNSYDTSGVNSIWDLLFFVPHYNNSFYLAGRLLVFIVLLLWGAKFMFSSVSSNYSGQSFMHLINLPFHEAGHIIFKPFGSFMASLGGTLGQMLMPIICMITLLIQTRDTFGASVTLWWFAQNFFDIAPYIYDARSGSLPLLGGNFGHSSPYGFHDWEFILTETGLLRFDHIISNLSVITGSFLMITSFLWGGIILYKQYNLSKKPNNYSL